MNFFHLLLVMCLAILFYPGVVFTLPKKGSFVTKSLTHTLLFTCVFLVLIYLYYTYVISDDVIEGAESRNNNRDEEDYRYEDHLDKEEERRRHDKDHRDKEEERRHRGDHRDKEEERRRRDKDHRDKEEERRRRGDHRDKEEERRRRRDHRDKEEERRRRGDHRDKEEERRRRGDEREIKKYERLERKNNHRGNTREEEKDRDMIKNLEHRKKHITHELNGTSIHHAYNLPGSTTQTTPPSGYSVPTARAYTTPAPVTRASTTPAPVTRALFKIKVGEEAPNTYLLAKPDANGEPISTTNSFNEATSFYLDSQSIPGAILISNDQDTLFLRLFGVLSADSKTTDQLSFINPSTKAQIGDISDTNVANGAKLFNYTLTHEWNPKNFYVQKSSPPNRTYMQ